MKTRKSKLGTIAITAAVTLLGAMINIHPVHAATIAVTSTADDGSAGTMRAALASAVDGDTIDATGVSGTIVLTNGELLVTNSVTILGPGPANLAVDGNAASRVFSIRSNLVVTIDSLTITHGFSGAPAAGGGILNDHSTLTVNNCNVSRNSTESGGGGIFNFGTFYGSATLTIVNSTFSNNSAEQAGGGINNSGGATGSATLMIVNSTFSGNSSEIGGGISSTTDNSGSATATIANSTFSGNSASSFGGGIRNFGIAPGKATLTIANSTFSGNSSLVGGGNIHNHFSGARVDIGSTILRTGGFGTNIFNGGGVASSHGFNLSSDDGGGILTATSDQINTDPKLGPLADNGGLTLTHLPLPGSPAIDQGSSDSLVALGITTDQRSFARTVDDFNTTNAFLGDGTDIGAVELQQFEAPNNAPVAKCKNVTVLAGPGGTASASIDDGSFDPDGDPITVVQTPPGPYPVGATTVTLAVTDSHGLSNSCSSVVTVVGVADLLVSLGVDKTSVKQGELLTYTITVHNFGPQDAANVVINDTLSSGSTFVSAHANRGNFTTPAPNQTGVVTWYLGDLPNGDIEGAQLVVKVIVRGKTTITNTATASTDSADPNPANNSASITTSVAAGGGKK